MRNLSPVLLLAVVGVLAPAAAVLIPHLGELAGRAGPARPFEVGLGPERTALVATLRRHTTPEARVLWEDQPRAKGASSWTALLPLLTERPFIGGLDPGGQIEHSYSGFVRAELAGRPDLMGKRTSLTLHEGMTGMLENAFINVKNRSHMITAEVEIPRGGANGVILAQAGRFGGWALYLKNGTPTYLYNLAGLERTTVAGVSDLLEAVCELLPHAWTASFAAAKVGLRPGTPDDLPIIGRSTVLPNVIYATGHYRNGVLLSGLTAQLVAGLLLDEAADPLLALTRPDRFGAM